MLIFDSARNMIAFSFQSCAKIKKNEYAQRYFE